MATQLASAMTSASRRPIVAVIGTTGVGKSNLAVSLAQSLSSRDSTSPPSNSVVLSADSMQLYKGLDVITNKITNEEKGGIEHWGIDVVRPGETWELGKWCTEADKKVRPMQTIKLIVDFVSWPVDSSHRLRWNPLLYSALSLSAGRASASKDTEKRQSSGSTMDTTMPMPASDRPGPGVESTVGNVLETGRSISIS